MAKEKFETVEKAAEESIEVVTARVVSRQGLAYVIEYTHGDRLYRVIHPQPLTGEVPLESVEMGIPYGVDWAAVIPGRTVMPSDFARELHKVGIWTPQDAMASPNVVISAIQAVYGIDLAAILVAAHKQEV